MPAFVITLILIVVIGLVCLAVVAVGMKGAFREKAPRAANHLAVAARHMNGDAEPPQALVDLVNSQAEAVRSAQREGGLGERIKSVKLPIRSADARRDDAAQTVADDVRPAEQKPRPQQPVIDATDSDAGAPQMAVAN
ncbi:hypothetical protein ACTQ49_12405 [Luteococcus sp. Sow4_B9]|uniref:hypothetical protein n=1 Tax=Luteococcus sp. Sow4_B9 TaxID=3438792 RepID=UPI003F9C8A53